MSLANRIGIAIAAVTAVFIMGYWYGQKSGREAALKAAVQSYQTRERINHETDNLDPVALCRALGGLREECTDLMRGLDTPASN